MKKFNFILFVLSLLIILPSCQRKHPTLYFFTDYLDMEYVYDYLPYEEGQILLFTNENKQDSCMLEISEIFDYNEYGTGYSPYYPFQIIEDGGQHCDVVYSVWLENIDTTNRKRFKCGLNFIDYNLTDKECYYYSEFNEVLTPTNYMDIPIPIEDINSYLPTELVIYDSNDSILEYAKCVNGVGITMFTDKEGKKWYFDSVISD
ncbi:MAG: hypothetical protein PUC14_06385 [Bacteroidales bacterium]|nr:hypothetical protein [Bacteroidales bacterium]